jgi:hypothetical protein
MGGGVAHVTGSRPWTSKQPFPPDATVPQDTSPAREAELRAAGDAGSANAEYALGLLLGGARRPRCRTGSMDTGRGPWVG